MTTLDTIKKELDDASKVNPDDLLRQCVVKRLVACDKRNDEELDAQVRDLMIKFDKLPLADMGRFIKRLSRTINKRYLDYTKQLISYRNSLNSKK